jgi:hypothetical protein
MVDEEGLLLEYNRRASHLMIDKIRISDFQDIVETLANFSILILKNDNMTSSGLGSKKKNRAVGLNVEIEELT